MHLCEPGPVAIEARECARSSRADSDTQAMMLLEAIARRDEQALATFYDQFAPLIMGLAMRILRSSHESEEVVAETFLQVWKHADGYRPELGTPLCWVITIARRRAIDRLRARQRHQDGIHRLRAESCDESIADNSADSCVKGERHAEVRAALDQLPPRDRRIILAAFFEGQTHHEIAAVMNLPLGTTKTVIRRGLLKLASMLSKVRATDHEHSYLTCEVTGHKASVLTPLQLVRSDEISGCRMSHFPRRITSPDTSTVRPAYESSIAFNGFPSWSAIRR